MRPRGEGALSASRENLATTLRELLHDLTNPVQTIVGYSMMILEDLGDLRLEYLEADIQRIVTAGNELQSLLTEGLNVAQIEANKTDLKTLRYDLRSILDLIVGYAGLMIDEVAETRFDSTKEDLKKIRLAATQLLEKFDENDFVKKWDYGYELAKENERKKAAKAEEKDEILGHLLICEDDNEVATFLKRLLTKERLEVDIAEDGLAGMEAIKAKAYDVILLDVGMPRQDGEETLKQLKASKQFQTIPVLMLSASGDLELVTRCIANGAEDYLSKPVNPKLLLARVNACLDKKRSRDREVAMLRQVFVEKEKSNRLLNSILPKSVVDRWHTGEQTIADVYDDATILLASIRGLGNLGERLAPRDYLPMLNDVYSGFDWLSEWAGFEKVTTYGDMYMVAGGVPNADSGHVEKVAHIASEMVRIASKFKSRHQLDLQLKVGIASERVCAGVVGHKYINYHLWGPAVSAARELEQIAQPWQVIVNSKFHQSMANDYAMRRAGGVKMADGSEDPYFAMGEKLEAKRKSA